jgi:hypothetical protein
MRLFGGKRHGQNQSNLVKNTKIWDWWNKHFEDKKNQFLRTCSLYL